MANQIMTAKIDDALDAVLELVGVEENKRAYGLKLAILQKLQDYGVVLVVLTETEDVF